jgi:hypothetical protein
MVYTKPTGSSRDSQVVIRLATGSMTEGLEFKSRKGMNFHFSVSSRSALGLIQTISQLVLGTKRPGREADS